VTIVTSTGFPSKREEYVISLARMNGVTPDARLPRPARWLLRTAPIRRETRPGVEADLLELFVRRRRDRGLLRAHGRLYLDVASLWWRGAQARTAARRSRLALLGDARADLRHASRMFARQPAIPLLTIAGLTMGLGIATAAFSIVNVAVLRGDGLVDPDRAPGVLRTTGRSTSTDWTYDEFLHLRAGAARMRVEAVFTDFPSVAIHGTDEGAARPMVAFVSGGFFGATGGRVRAGRPLEIADERPGGSIPVVVSFAFWTARFNDDPAVVGRTLRIGRTPATIVGVAERGFSVPRSAQIWMPLTAYAAVHDATPVTRAPDVSVQVFGRLRPDVGLAEAEAQLSAVAAVLAGGAAAGEPRLRVRLDPRAGLGREASANNLAITLLVSAGIGLVLMLVGANVATVLVAAAITREREMGVRAALGASRWRIVRQLVTESLAMGAIAAPIGLLFAWWAMPTIGAMIGARDVDLRPDLTVYVFLGLVMLVTGIGAGLAPALHSRGADLVTPLKGEGHGQHRLAPRRLRSALVIAQAAASVLLIIMATLFVRATIRAAALDVGFDPAGLYVVAPLSFESDSVRSEAWARALTELPAVPGISAVTLTELSPLGGAFRASGSREEPSRLVLLNRVHAGYFETLGLRVLTGRTFTPDELASKASVVVVSESVARAFWQDQSPLGELVPQQIPLEGARPIVVGIVADALTTRLEGENTFAIYEPLDPASRRSAWLLIRASSETTAIDPATQWLRSVDPDADLRISSIAARLEQAVDGPGMLATLTGVVGIVAIVLSVIGLYGLTASVAGQRAREMSVRVAMGAEPRDLLRLLMWDSLRPVVIGLAVGSAAALFVGRLMAATMLFGVSPRDPIAYAGAAAILLVAAMLAVLVPTRRAARVDAALVLR
jgi:predicted permease